MTENGRIRDECREEFQDITNSLAGIKTDLEQIKKIYLGNGSPPLSVRLDRVESEMTSMREIRARITDSKYTIATTIIAQAIWGAVTIIGVGAAAWLMQ